MPRPEVWPQLLRSAATGDTPRSTSRYLPKVKHARIAVLVFTVLPVFSTKWRAWYLRQFVTYLLILKDLPRFVRKTHFLRHRLSAARFFGGPKRPGAGRRARWGRDPLRRIARTARNPKSRTVRSV